MEKVEVWKSIPGYEGHYEMSRTGEVKSLSRVILAGGKYPFVSKERMLKAHVNNRGYYKINLYLNRKMKTIEIHQLLAITFLNHIPCGSELVVDHIDTNKLNNNVDNLRIVTSRINSNRKHIKSSSQYTGVTLSVSSKKWTAQVYVNGKHKYLGSFDSEEEASLYYENALKNNLIGLPIEVKKPNWTSNYIGVSWVKDREKWLASISIKGKVKNLGLFNTEIEASIVYKEALKIKLAS